MAITEAGNGVTALGRKEQHVLCHQLLSGHLQGNDSAHTAHKQASYQPPMRHFKTD